MSTELIDLWKAVCRVLTNSFGQIFAAHLSYLALGILLFTPLAGILGQFILSLSGKTVLSDLDILYFFLTPAGMAAVILFGALVITLLVFEQASLMAVCLASLEGMRMTMIGSLYFTASRVKNIFLFTLNLVIRVLLITLPFIAVAGAIGWGLISEYDINYYLAEKPPVFLAAAATIGLVLIIMLGVLIRNLLAWSFTLPLLLFGPVTPSQTFKLSQALTKGQKTVLFIALGIWALAATLVGALVFGCIHFLGSALASINRAIKDRCDWIEIDVQESRDGEVVVIHDQDFMKLANVNSKVWDSSLEQVQRIDVGSWFSPGFAGETVPTLAQALEAAKGKSRVLIELKYYGHDEQLEQRVADIVEQAGMVNEVAVMSLSYNGVKKFRALRPGWPIGLLSSKTVGNLADLDVDFLAINMATITPGLIRRIQSSGKQLFVWTVNDQVSMFRMISFGVDGRITDEPGPGMRVACFIRVLKKSLQMFDPWAPDSRSPAKHLFLHSSTVYRLTPHSLYPEI